MVIISFFSLVINETRNNHLLGFIHLIKTIFRLTTNCLGNVQVLQGQHFGIFKVNINEHIKAKLSQSLPQ